MNATDKAVERIKAAGFTHIKFELEGDLGRDSSSTCYDCDGSGNMQCNNCDGEGAVEEEVYVGQGYRSNWVECDDCSGDGEVNCDGCDGSGEHSGDMGEKECEDFLIDHVSQEARDALTFPHLDCRRDNPREYYATPHDHMGFYEDGSVDSEFTFTIPVEKWRTAKEWIKAFNMLGAECGNGEVITTGAGMHVSLLTSGVYPSDTRLNAAGLANFSSEVSKLLPALFFLASADHRSRDLGYRNPQISDGNKYSAIFTHHGTCLEYRVFETCYDRPDAIEEYIQVMANTLKYYTDTSLKAKQLGKQFEFSEGDTLARFFSTAEQLRILNAQIKELKPADRTIKKLKADRGVSKSIKELSQMEKSTKKRLTQEYHEYRKHCESRMKQELTRDEREYVEMLVQREHVTMEQSIARLRGIRLQSMTEFIRENLQTALRGSRYYNAVTITV